MNRILWKKAAFAVFVAGLVFFCVGCAVGKGYTSMSMDEAREIIEEDTDHEYLIVDVRTQEEYDKGHIPGAMLLPLADIREGNVDALPDKDQAMMVYCWTGRRSEDSAILLVDMGYKNVYDIGGFIDWTGDVEGENLEEENVEGENLDE